MLTLPFPAFFQSIEIFGRCGFGIFKISLLNACFTLDNPREIVPYMLDILLPADDFIAPNFDFMIDSILPSRPPVSALSRLYMLLNRLT